MDPDSAIEDYFRNGRWDMEGLLSDMEIAKDDDTDEPSSAGVEESHEYADDELMQMTPSEPPTTTGRRPTITPIKIPAPIKIPR